MYRACCYVFYLIFLFVQAECSREVRLSCGDDEELERGLPGAPGKRGVAGLKGEKGETGYGEKGNNGDQRSCDECRESVIRLEERSQMLQMSVEKLERRTLQLEEEANATKQEAKLQVSSRRDCNDVADQGFTRSGVYEITVDRRVVSVYCDFETDGEKWLIIQRRLDGSVDFFLFWEQYARGFGNVEHEFWLGLENIHSITSSGLYRLRVDLEDWEGNTAYALYSSFSVEDSASNYRLQVSGYSGTAGNSLSYHNNQAFTTRDRDNDEDPSTQCADHAQGAWWYRTCAVSSLNGRYLGEEREHYTGVGWYDWKNNWYSMKKAEMKISRN